MSDQDRSRNHRDRQPRPEQAERPQWQQRVDRPERADKPKSPLIPHEITPEDLEMGVRVQLKTLTAENAEMVARHLAMVAIVADQDPELAHRHALAAASRAGRIAVVRETVAITAYFVEDWAMSLREFLAHRRMTASNEHLPMMVDCERGLERPKRALELGRSVDRESLPAAVRVNLAIAMSGARLDLGENEQALAELEIRELDPTKVFEYSAPLFWAYSDTLEVLGKTAEAKKWAELGDRAAKAVAAKNDSGEESLEVIEELTIPQASEFVRREPREGFSPRPRESRPGFDRGDRPRRDGDRPARPTREGGRPARTPRDGERPRTGGGFRDGERSDRPRRDGDRPSRPPRDGNSGPRTGGPRSGGPRPGNGPRPGGGPRGGAPRGGRPGGSRGR